MTKDAARLKVMFKPGIGGLTPLLCTADGVELPGQVAVRIETAVDDIATVTVTFCAIEFAEQ